MAVVPHIQQDVKLYRGLLIVQTHTPHQVEVTKTLVDDWYRERAHLKFRERVELCRQRFADPDEFTPKGIIIRRLQQRWGSMTPKANLILNQSLIRASVDAIDYVITHELCHLRHAHHGSEFYKLLDRSCRTGKNEKSSWSANWPNLGDAHGRLGRGDGPKS